ncbi:uncharacterized protein ANIA_00368 [Aspergillus nidulans FGSC A4]|uniref:Reverse transcriptase n=1 Tax=Emericella nidulans (strain FGSC A4 / ATCC 38163 / CBS 112.46 / NRRL 194 / M139) TaxID=227321 RepID=C8VTR9_EMENI|nr:hypothetical protein [Aspergillus nidulans FGSC A4]CBF89628.1 TPA: conserved hypothetical protein [Aspergillus nidulans FGSC A4]
MKILQANVGRGGAVHDLLLSFEADIILVQEPWTNTAKHLTKTHPRYQLFSPPTRWTARPRTLTYVRRDLPAHSLPEPISPDITTIYTAGLTIINVYRPPNDPQPDTESHAVTPGATGLLDWLDAHELELRLEPGTPTRGPNTLDLVFSNLPLRALVEDHLKTPSDHATIGIILEQEEPPPIYKLGSTNWEKARALASPPDPTLPIDLLAKQLVQTSQLAIQGVSRYNTRRLPRTLWWTPELTDILHQTRQQQNPDYKQLRKAIVRAKAEYWKQRIEQATAPIDVFKLAKWIQHPDQLAAPPLNIQGAQVTTPQGKADAFLNHLLEKGALLPNQTEEGPPNKPLGSLHLPTKEHCWAALCAPPPSAPGEDGLATTAWRELWPVLGDTITQLYYRCMEEGCFPLSLKSAKVIMLPKPGKRDYTQLNAWRPISLLSTLGKGLERLLAQQIAVRAIQADVLAPCHFGALPGRSAIDLVQVLVHRVEEAFQQGKDASLLLLDVKGAFDAVIHQQLLSHLRLQGWHKGLLQLLKDWLTGRSVSVHIKEGTATAPIKGGLPQGSPLSPILFLLYAARIVSTLEGSFCYADDMGILLTGNTLEESSQQLVEAYKQITALGTETGLPFSIEKTEIQHFSRKQQQHLPTVTLPGIGGITPSLYTRWLGVLLDTKLTFKAHINLVFSHGKRLAQHLKRLSNTQRGCPVAFMRAAVIQYVLPTALYGAEVFYTGKQQKGVVNSLLSLFRTAALAIIPAYKTTPTAALLREADLPDPEALLNSILRRAAVSKGHGPAGPRTEVYDAEIMGAVEGLRTALGQPCVGYSTQLVILLDNLAAASLLASYRPTPHRHGLSETFSQLAAQWMESPSILTMQWKPLQVRWIPGHSGIAGNELADKLAKLGSSIYSPDIPPSPAYLRQEAKQWLRTETYTAYANKAPETYKALNIRPHTKESRSREHKLPRWVLGRLVAARTGHGDFTAYHQRFDHTDYLESCTCGKAKTPVHFFFCPYTRKRWKDRWRCIKDGPSKTIDWLLSTAAGAEEFSRIVQESSFFKDICPNWARRSA